MKEHDALVTQEAQEAQEGVSGSRIYIFSFSFISKFKFLNTSKEEC